MFILEKLYLNNPYLREIESKIISKTYKDGKYYIKLNRTIFYPHLSGGQPGDKGTINGVEVLEVFEEYDEIIHVTKENISKENVTLSIDWENRLDNMQQHTGQHLLSAGFSKLYGGETVGFHIGKDYVYVDITLPELSEEDANKIETYVNKIIYSNFEIKSYFIEKNKIDEIPLRKKPTVNSNIRIVEIDNIDFSPCAGTHVRSTGELGIIKIRKWEKYKGNIRVEFVCGIRALLDYQMKTDVIKNISNILSSKDIDSFNKVQILLNQKEELEKLNSKLKEEIVAYKAENLIAKSKQYKKYNFIVESFDSVDLKNIIALSSYLNKRDDFIQIYGSSNEDKSSFLVSISKNININLKDIFKEISAKYPIRGGGSTDTIQGGSSIDNLENILNEFITKIKEKI